MGRVGSVAIVALFISACAPTMEERVHDFNTSGVQLFQQGEYDRAREIFQAALMLQPNDAALLFNMGQCLDHLGQTKRAEELYQECLQKDPNQDDCRHALAVLLVNGGRINEAQNMTQTWLASEPKRSAAYTEDGWLYQQEGDPFKALARYQQAIDLDPHNVHALIGMGQVYEELKLLPRALQLYQTALEYNARQPDLVKRIKRLRAQGVGAPHPD